MSELLDELNILTDKVQDLDVSLLDKKVDQMMPELGFGQDDNDRLVASYRCTSARHQVSRNLTESATGQGPPFSKISQRRLRAHANNGKAYS